MSRVAPRLRPSALVLLVAALLVTAVPSAAVASTDVNQVVDITFPVHDPEGLTSYSDDYHSPRSRGDHGATDIGGPRAYGLRVHAAVGGRVSFITGVDGAALPSYGWMIRIEGTDGRTYNYIHLGRQDGPASEAYAPGIRRGSTVQRGQHIGFVGHSGNASASWPHLHFEIVDPAVTDRQGSNRINPYNSLEDAERRGDLPALAVRTAGQGFSDVGPRHTHIDGITYVDVNEITSGCGGWRYCPGRDVTRGQMATFLTKALALPPGGDSGFSDVRGHTHEAGIRAVVAAGIARGVEEGRFAPDTPMRRDQMASLLATALDLPAGDATFTDVAEDSPHREAISAVAAADITSGIGDGRFGPAQPVTRAQMATFLMKATG